MRISPFRIAPFVTAALILFHAPATAQDGALSVSTEDLTSGDAIADAASSIADAGEDKLLIGNMLDKEIEGSDGETIGTVEDFVVIPGGRLVAAIVKLDDDTRIAIPFGAVKVAGSADDLGLEVPIEASEIEDMDELKDLADSINGD